jgi:hypothetical protein
MDMKPVRQSDLMAVSTALAQIEVLFTAIAAIHSGSLPESQAIKSLCSETLAQMGKEIAAKAFHINTESC